MVAKITERKREAAASFADMFDGDDRPSPEQVMVDVMHGTPKGRRYTARQIEAAKLLVPYRLPKLSNIEAEVTTRTYEDFLRDLDDDGSSE